MWFFVLVFLLWPLIEIGGFIAVGRAIGILPTLLAILASGVVGAALLRFEGVRVLRQTVAALQSGKRPDVVLAHAGLTALGGLLLLLPCFFSDFVGLALFLPPVRSGLIAFLSWVLGPVVVVETRTGRAAGPGVVDLEPGEWRRGATAGIEPPSLAAPERDREDGRGAGRDDGRGGPAA